MIVGLLKNCCERRGGETRLRHGKYEYTTGHRWFVKDSCIRAIKLHDKVSLGIEGLYYFFDDRMIHAHAYNDKNKDTFTGITEEDGGFYTVSARLTYHFGHRSQEGAYEMEPLK